MHQLWQAVILKALKLGGCILHFWKPSIFINLVPTGQGHSCVLNAEKSILQICGWFHNSLFTRGLYPFFNDCKKRSIFCRLASWNWASIILFILGSLGNIQNKCPVLHLFLVKTIHRFSQITLGQIDFKPSTKYDGFHFQIYITVFTGDDYGKGYI